MVLEFGTKSLTLLYLTILLFDCYYVMTRISQS